MSLRVFSVGKDFPKRFETSFGEPLRFGLPGPNAMILESDAGWVCYEVFFETIFIHFAATFPHARGLGEAIPGMEKVMEWFRDSCHGATRVQIVTKRENTAPQVVAIKSGFLVSGINTGRTGELEVIWSRRL